MATGSNARPTPCAPDSFPHFLISFFPDSKNLNLRKSAQSADLQSPYTSCSSWFIHRREHGGRREVVVRRFPRPRFAQIFFNREKRKLRQSSRILFSLLICEICGQPNSLRIAGDLREKAAPSRRTPKRFARNSHRSSFLQIKCAEDSARYNWRLIQTPYSFTLYRFYILTNHARQSLISETNSCRRDR